MTKKKLIEKLELISGELQDLPGDSSLKSAADDVLKVMDHLDELIVEIESESEIK